MRSALLLAFAACSFEPGRTALVDASEVAIDTATADTETVELDAGADALMCPASYAPTSPYRLITTLQTWLLAEQECEADSAGFTHLVVPTTMPNAL